MVKAKNTSLEADLRALGFEKAMSEVRPLLYLAIDGRDKSGKTHFALTAPGDIGVIDINRGLEGVIQKFQKKKDIYHLKVETARDQQTAITNFRKFEEAWRKLLTETKVRSLIVDNFGEVWELARIAQFGQQSSRARNYGDLNALMDELLDMPLDEANQNTNVILIHNLKDEWVDDKQTGRLARWGYKNTKHKAQINALIEMPGEYYDRLRYVGTDTYKSEARDTDDTTKHRLTINNSRFDSDDKDQMFEDDKCNFKSLAMWVHPKVPSSHWD